MSASQVVWLAAIDHLSCYNKPRCNDRSIDDQWNVERRSTERLNRLRCVLVTQPSHSEAMSIKKYRVPTGCCFRAAQALLR